MNPFNFESVCGVKGNNLNKGVTCTTSTKGDYSWILYKITEHVNVFRIFGPDFLMQTFIPLRRLVRIASIIVVFETRASPIKSL